jgi:hypothetical protein
MRGNRRTCSLSQTSCQRSGHARIQPWWIAVDDMQQGKAAGSRSRTGCGVVLMFVAALARRAQPWFWLWDAARVCSKWFARHRLRGRGRQKRIASNKHDLVGEKLGVYL